MCKHKWCSILLAGLLLLLISSACTSSRSNGITNDSSSRIRDLEAKITQLEATNKQLQTENQQLSDALKRVQNVVSSPNYSHALAELSAIKGKTSELTLFANGLPDLPSLPPGLTVSQINDAVIKARNLRQVIANMPKLPPTGWPPFIPFPQELLALETSRQTFISVTTWMENLQDLPSFLNTAGSLKELKSRTTGYLLNIGQTYSEVDSILKQIQSATNNR